MARTEQMPGLRARKSTIGKALCKQRLALAVWQWPWRLRRGEGRVAMALAFAMTVGDGGREMAVGRWRGAWASALEFSHTLLQWLLPSGSPGFGPLSLQSAKPRAQAACNRCSAEICAGHWRSEEAAWRQTGYHRSL